MPLPPIKIIYFVNYHECTDFVWQKGQMSFISHSLHGKKAGGNSNKRTRDLSKGPFPIGNKSDDEDIT